MLFSLTIVLVAANILFFVGLTGLFFTIKSNFFLIISVEIMFMSINFNFLFFSIYLDSIQGIVFIFYIMIISAMEIVILLSFFILYYKKVYILDILESFNNMKH